MDARSAYHSDGGDEIPELNFANRAIKHLRLITGDKGVMTNLGKHPNAIGIFSKSEAKTEGKKKCGIGERCNLRSAPLNRYYSRITKWDAVLLSYSDVSELSDLANETQGTLAYPDMNAPCDVSGHLQDERRCPRAFADRLSKRYRIRNLFLYNTMEYSCNVPWKQDSS